MIFKTVSRLSSIEAQFWESPFREDSGLPTLTLAFALRLYFTLLVSVPLTPHFIPPSPTSQSSSHFTHSIPSLTRSTTTHSLSPPPLSSNSTSHSPLSTSSLTRSTASHSPHSLLLLLCCGAHLVFSSGTVSSRNTRQAEHPAEAPRKAPWKLSSSTATQHAAETIT